MSKWEKLDVTIVGRIAKYGNGLCISIPKPLVDAYGLKSGDNVKITVEEFKKFGKPDQGTLA